MLNRLAAKIVNLFLKTHISDLTCGFRALNKETMLRLNLPGDFTIRKKLVSMLSEKNLKIVWVPVTVTYFADRKSRVVRTIGQFVSTSEYYHKKLFIDVRPLLNSLLF